MRYNSFNVFISTFFMDNGQSYEKKTNIGIYSEMIFNSNTETRRHRVFNTQ